MAELTGMGQERAISVGVNLPNVPIQRVEENLDELRALVRSAGGEVVHRIIQTRKAIDAATFIGRGKAKELASLRRKHGASLIVFDDELSPGQVRNLEQILNCRVTDRTGVILDIFARRARSREAKTQVELAQYTYLLPRLTRAWTHLSRQAGGIGTRGIGETQLETDRRVIRKRITKLKRELKKIASRRKVQGRRRSNLFEIALVGYTNAGKSSLLNNLTSARVRVENGLFTTLDTTFRRLYVEGASRKIILIDTVGLVRKLPHHLVASFRSTLEQAGEASLILHVVDVSRPGHEERALTTRALLSEMKLDEVPVLTVFNKIDVAPEALVQRAENLYPEGLFLSAKTGEGTDALLSEIRTIAQRSFHLKRYLVPLAVWPELKALSQSGSITLSGEIFLKEGIEVFMGGAPEVTEELVERLALTRLAR